MPFQKKVQATDPLENDAVANTSVPTKKIEKKDVAAEVKAQRELYEKNQEIEQLKKELELSKERESVKPALVAVAGNTQAPGLNEIADLRAQINLLASQVRTGATGDKLKFRMPTSADLIPMDKAVTFTARSVFYVVGSYMDKNGLECLPPFKLIVFT